MMYEVGINFSHLICKQKLNLILFLYLKNFLLEI